MSGFNSEMHFMLPSMIPIFFSNKIGKSNQICTILLLYFFFIHIPEFRQTFLAFFLMQNYQIVSLSLSWKKAECQKS